MCEENEEVEEQKAMKKSSETHSFSYCLVASFSTGIHCAKEESEQL